MRPRESLTPVLAFLLLAACAGDGPAPGGELSWFEEIQRDTFDQSCVAGACHDSATRAGNLSLVAGESYDQLVDIEPDNAVARANGLLRVEPFSVAGSFLVKKLTGVLEQGEGARMPLGAAELPAAQIAFIVAWIEAGASPTAPPPDTGSTLDGTVRSHGRTPAGPGRE